MSRPLGCERLVCAQVVPLAIEWASLSVWVLVLVVCMRTCLYYNINGFMICTNIYIRIFVEVYVDLIAAKLIITIVVLTSHNSNAYDEHIQRPINELHLYGCNILLLNCGKDHH